MDFTKILLFNMIALGSPLALAAMGGFASERSGIMNIALEGNMLVGAIATALIGHLTKSPWLGLLGGVSAAVVLSLLHWLLTQYYRMDHIVSGMAINLLAFGVANFLDQKYTDPTAGEIPTLKINAYYTVAIVLPFLIAAYMRYTKGGLRLFAVGNDPSKSRQMGLSPVKVRFLALTITGVFCGLSGALIVSTARYYTDNMTAGDGFIALAALILGSWRPIPALIACLVFGMFKGLEIQLQGVPVFGVHIPREFWFSLPYLITVVALAGFLGKSRVPAGLGKT
ncbi:MAG TPA: ABC transporter permease [Fimbriimonadaceae bacterium]|jgi:simple sugar transport system permease protein